MKKRLLLLLAMWPLLAHADPKYGDYGWLLAAIELIVLGVMPLVVAQVVGRVLRWLMRRRFNLWVLSGAALVGCWLGMSRPLDFNRPEREPVPPGTVLTVAVRPSSPSPPPSVRYLAAFSAVAVILTALATAAIAFLEQRNQYPEQEE